MLSFNNTEIAFSTKNDADLKKAFWLFKIISNNTIVKIGNKLTNIALKIELPINGIIKATIFKQFCGGETIEECDEKIKLLGSSNIGTILDYSVEGKETESDFDNCVNETLKTIHKSKTTEHIPFCVFKVTGLARFELLEKIALNEPLNTEEQKEFERIQERINTICKMAHACGTPVFIDAEQSWIQGAIDSMAHKMMAMYNKQAPIVYNTFQLYRNDRLNYLQQCFKTAQKENYYLGAKLVRGAYMEKERERAIEKNYPSPIHTDKESTDRDYDAAIFFCLENTDRIGFCAASHNEKSMMYLAWLMEEKQIAKNNKHIYFGQLLGMSDHISYNLANAGYNVAKYVPYGPVNEVIPYLIRRAQENTFMKGQTGRELGLIIKEKKRRAAKR